MCWCASRNSVGKHCLTLHRDCVDSCMQSAENKMHAAAKPRCSISLTEPTSLNTLTLLFCCLASTCISFRKCKSFRYYSVFLPPFFFSNKNTLWRCWWLRDGAKVGELFRQALNQHICERRHLVNTPPTSTAALTQIQRCCANLV